jgi:ferritin-like metal-binding protein YciE
MAARAKPTFHVLACEVIVARDKNEAINSYIGDMLALEDHIEKALKGQLTDLKDYPDVVTELRQIHRQVEHHIADLRALSDRRKAGGVAEAVKRAGSAVAGAAAGLIDLVRSEGLPKNLRDDYTAFNLANIGYLMLHTTALALGDQEVADLGRQHFRDYAAAILRFDTLVPESVVRYLQQEGLPATDVVSQVSKTVKEAWDQAVDTGAAETVTQGQR